MSRGARSAAALALAALLAAGGCTSTDEPPPVRPNHPKTAVPADRDDRAVVAALRRIDPCALIEPAAGVPAGASATADGPHDCRLRAGGSKLVAVVLGTPLEPRERYDLQLLDFGGVKGYFDPGRGGMCRAYLPVSFSKAIQFRADRIGSRCEQVKALAAAAAAKLNAPESLTNSLPLATWDACTALASLRSSAEPAPGEFIDGIDKCTAAGPQVTVRLDYGDDPGAEAETAEQKIITIAGKRVRSYAIPQCVLAWSQQPAAPGNRTANVEITASTCEQARSLAETAIRRLGEAPPPATTPQHPLTYRMDEPDVAAAGACADTRDAVDCEPYHEIGLPAGRDAVLRVAAVDPNAQCALALGPVRGHFGPAMTPVTMKRSDTAASRQCLFVEPSHGIEVGVHLAVTPDDPPPFPRNGGGDITLAGRTGTATDLEDTPSGAGRGLSIPLGDQPDSGALRVWVRLAPPRGTEPKQPVDAAKAALVDRVVTDVLTQRLS
ncbi:hypothetical protein [Amycolatopsis anabasis]|uniref:hypothetical protein n=1 Tax=Amycolatopsis anabasis TaxID=1840409 RepID=UPI00131C3DD7|nr:hypothetical protein [Amycolatopsis anabasis]